MARAVPGAAPDELHCMPEGGSGLGPRYPVHHEAVPHLVTRDRGMRERPETSVDRAWVHTHEPQLTLKQLYVG
jgi:hypothetical protein